MVGAQLGVVGREDDRVVVMRIADRAGDRRHVRIVAAGVGAAARERRLRGPRQRAEALVVVAVVAGRLVVDDALVVAFASMSASGTSSRIWIKNLPSSVTRRRRNR